MVLQAMSSGFATLPWAAALLAKGIPAAARSPASRAVSAVRGHARALSVQTALGMKEGLCYLFSSKNQLLLNSCFSSQVSASLRVQ